MTKEVQEYSKFQWFFIVIFIPTVFAIILFVILLNFMGVNVIDETKQVAAKIPILSEYVKTEEQIQLEEEQETFEELQLSLRNQENEISRLNQSIVSKDQENQSLIDEINMLMLQLEELQDEKLEVIAEYKEIAKLYEGMSTKNAASILVELSTEQAAVHLSYIKLDSRAAILAQMPPEKAAELITLISAQ